MPSTLRKLPDHIVLTCSQYALDIGREDREAFRRDPEALIRQLIQAADAPPPNAVFVDDAARDAILAADDAGAPNPPFMVHVDLPTTHASRWIIFTMSQ